MSLIGAVDIGGTKIAVGAVRDDGTIVYRSECPTDPARGFADAMSRVRHMLHEAGDTCGQLEGIGVGCPGPVDPATGIIGIVGNLPGWEGGNLVDALKGNSAASVAVENDADAAALAELNWGTASKSKSFIYITISTGIGGGIVLEGKLHRGVQGSHPELGHQIIDNSGPLCYCGARGCWESLASGTAMSAWFREASPQSILMSAEDICALARQQDRLAVQAVEREGYYLGLGLANIVTLFTPEEIALGGGVMKSSELFLGHAINVVRQVCTQVPAEKTSIKLASLGSNSALLGAAQAWLQRNL